MQDLDKMRYAGKVNKSAIEWGFTKALPGVSLKEIDEHIEWYIRKAGCVPAFKNYKPDGYLQAFPYSSCLSPNDTVVHGVPNDYILKPGDLLTIDIGTENEGMFVDAARTRIIPGASTKTEINNSFKGQNLIDVTEAILQAQLDLVKDQCDLLSMALAAEAVAQKHGVIILSQWGGHGISDKIHTEPFIPSSINRNQSKIKQGVEERRYARQILTKGQTICIEPVVSFGTPDIIVEDDLWTIKKADSHLTAHTERCIVITENGYEELS